VALAANLGIAAAKLAAALFTVSISCRAGAEASPRLSSAWEIFLATAWLVGSAARIGELFLPPGGCDLSYSLRGVGALRRSVGWGWES